MWKFSQSPLNRNSHLRNQSAQLSLWRKQENCQLIVFNEKYQILLQPDGIHPVNTLRHEATQETHKWIYLGHHKETPWFCTRVLSDQFELNFHQQWHDLRLALPMIAEPYASIIAYGKALLYWHSHHKFCGKCGSKTYVHKAGHELFCEQCDKAIFPRTDPAIIVSVTFNDQLLLARQSIWPANRYSVLAGFVEPGESFEQAVQREVWEESQLKVRDVEYIGSQPWPFPCSLMVGFTAKATSSEFTLLDQELEKALWVSRDNIDELITSGQLKLSSPESISYHLIEHWAHQHGISLAKYA